MLLVWNLVKVAIAYLPSLPNGALAGIWLPDPQAIESLTVIATMFAFFFVLEFGGAALAYALEKEPPYDLFWMFWQRFVYRQLMYIVVIRSLRQALLGRRAGWDKLERKGTAKSAHKGPAEALP